MPPKIKITKQNILEQALRLVRERGVAALTAKSLAEALNCSTQPIFWQFENMDALKKAIFAEAMAIFGRALRRENDCESRYMSVGLNYIRFAIEERELFRMLFMSDFGKTDLVGAAVEMEYVLSVIEEAEHISGPKAQIIYKDMWLFSHGIAAMLAAETANFTEQEIRGMLSDVCRGLISILDRKSTE